MRKDIFIVGAILLGLWLFIGAIGPLLYLLAMLFGSFHPQTEAQDYTLLNGVVHLLIGLYLMFRPDDVFNLLERMRAKREANKM